MPKLENGEEHTNIIYTRIDAVVQLILKNDRYLQSRRCKELCATMMKEFNVAERTAERYVAEAKKEIRHLSSVKKARAFNRAVRDREYIVNAAKTGDDLKLALEAMKDRDKLFGLYEDKVIHSGEVAVTFIEKLDE